MLNKILELKSKGYIVKILQEPISAIGMHIWVGKGDYVVDRYIHVMYEEILQFQTIVDGVWAGNYGNGNERKKRFKRYGYDYNVIQPLVNNRIVTYEALYKQRFYKAIDEMVAEIERLEKNAK